MKEDRHHHHSTSLTDESNIQIFNDNTPLLPITGFPQMVQDLIKSCQDIYRTPRDYWANSAIAAVALGIGNKLRLVGKYENIPTFWAVNVGGVSSGKTEPQSFMLKPFRTMDNKAFAIYEAEFAEYKRLIRQYKKGQPNEPEIPLWYQFIVKDATPEALSVICKINKRGIIFDRDELFGWISDFNRYNKSGEQSTFLSTWMGLSYVINRKGGEPLNIPEPNINVLGGIQPDLLPKLAMDDRGENGFVARMCFAYPDGDEKQPYNDAMVPKQLYNEWEQLIIDLVNLPEVYKIKLSPEALTIYETWYNNNVNIINGETSQHLKGVFGKLDIISLRLVIVFHGMKMILGGDASETVSAKTMMAALSVTEYYRKTAIKVYIRMGMDSKQITKNNAIIWSVENLDRQKTEIAEFFGTSRSQIERLIKK